MTTKPNPGSPEAIAKGCICPRMDNSNGKGSGYTSDDGTPLFFVTLGCPVHSPGGLKLEPISEEARNKVWPSRQEVKTALRKHHKELVSVYNERDRILRADNAEEA